MLVFYSLVSTFVVAYKIVCIVASYMSVLVHYMIVSSVGHNLLEALVVVHNLVLVLAHILLALEEGAYRPAWYLEEVCRPALLEEVACMRALQLVEVLVCYRKALRVVCMLVLLVVEGYTKVLVQVLVLVCMKQPVDFLDSSVLPQVWVCAPRVLEGSHRTDR